LLSKYKSANYIKAVIFFLASIWFITYCLTTSSPNPLVLCLGFFVIMPITMLQWTWFAAQYLPRIGGFFLTKKNYQLSLLCSSAGCDLCAWWDNWFKLAGMQNLVLSRVYLHNLVVKADSFYLSDKIEEAIAIRKQIVEVASAAGYNCDAAKACDFLAFFYRKKKDTVHARHWTERAIAYYGNLSPESCICGKTHAHLSGKHAALLAWNALDSQTQGFSNAADGAARKAEEILSGCQVGQGEVALMRLMDYYFKAKNWEKFAPAAERYLKGKWTDEQKSSLFLAGQAYNRLGDMYMEEGKYDQAEASYTAGMDFARRAGRNDLITKIEKASAKLLTKKHAGDEKPAQA
jgi:tetratricopeptide (TPR) repeat protein